MVFNASRSWAKRLADMRGRSGKDAMISAHHWFPGTCRTRKSPARPSACARSCATHARSAMRAGRREPIASCSGRCAISSRIRNQFPTMTANEELLIGLVSISDRASSGVYEDEGIPALEEWFSRAVATPWRTETRLIPDERPVIESTLVDLVDRHGCHLVLTTGGTGPAPRDVTPEATLAVAAKPMPRIG